VGSKLQLKYLSKLTRNVKGQLRVRTEVFEN
jgi:hypothetical protein